MANFRSRDNINRLPVNIDSKIVIKFSRQILFFIYVLILHVSV